VEDLDGNDDSGPDDDAGPPQGTPARTERVVVDAARRGGRLDVALAALVPGVSRSAAQRLVEGGLVRVDGRRRPQGYRVGEGAVLEVEIPATAPRAAPGPMPGELPILYEDDALLAVDKRPGLVVHPGAGHQSGTLVNLLLASGRALSVLGGPDRPGLVHRLDRDTSGVMVVAKTDAAHEALSRQFKDRVVRKAYLALVLGAHVPDRGLIESSFGRRTGDRKQFTGRVAAGREAVTELRAVLRGGLCALVLALPRTGRTHQIRVHLAEGGHPIVGDHVYGRAYPKPGSRPEGEADALRAVHRHALHAWCLAIRHPVTGQPMRFTAPIPRDLATVFAAVFGPDWAGALPDPFAS
jgi:23S rRNA pseudouridine1911/1915/1917 synthase